MIVWILGGLFVLLAVFFILKSGGFDGITTKGIAALKDGRLDEAEQHFQAALKIAQSMGEGRRSDREVTAWLRLSLVASKRGQNQEAMQRAGHSLEAMSRVRCTNAGNFNKVFGHIADILEQNGEYEDAVQFRRLQVKTTPAQTSQDADAITGSLIKLARALKNADHPAEAVIAYESVCKLPQSSNIAHARMEMAGMLRKLGKFDEAEQQHQQAIEMFRKAGAKEELNLAVAFSNLGVFYSETQRFEQALTVYQQSLDLRRKLFGESSSRYAVTQNNLANCLRQLNRLQEAAASATSSTALLRADNHKALPNALATLGLTLRDAGSLDEAERCLAEACAILKASPDRNAEDYRKFTGHYADLLERLDRHAEAAQARAEADGVNEERKSTRTLAAILDPVLTSMKLA